MDEFVIPSAANHAGSLLRAYAYRATDIQAPLQLHWSFALKDNALVSCILIAENVVYLVDSASFFSSVDARSGTLLWCFSTDGVAGDEANAC